MEKKLRQWETSIEKLLDQHMSQLIQTSLAGVAGTRRAGDSGDRTRVAVVSTRPGAKQATLASQLRMITSESIDQKEPGRVR